VHLGRAFVEEEEEEEEEYDGEENEHEEEQERWQPLDDPPQLWDRPPHPQGLAEASPYDQRKNQPSEGACEYGLVTKIACGCHICGQFWGGCRWRPTQ